MTEYTCRPPCVNVEPTGRKRSVMEGRRDSWVILAEDLTRRNTQGIDVLAAASALYPVWTGHCPPRTVRPADLVPSLSPLSNSAWQELWSYPFCRKVNGAWEVEVAWPSGTVFINPRAFQRTGSLAYVGNVSLVLTESISSH